MKERWKMKFINKKFIMEVFNSGSLYFQIKEPYLSNNDFNNKEISDFIDEHYNGGK